MATSNTPDMSESVYGLGITPGLGYITGPEGQRAEAEALRKDRSHARRVVVSLVGRERQGKTSLRRLLAGEPFNKEEPSTVGLEKDLVDTQALDPGSGPGHDWRAVQVDFANRQEFHEVLGQKIHQRLENRRHRIPATRRVLNAFLTMTKIGVISYVSMLFFFVVMSCSSLRAAPVWGITMVGMFLLCGATFGRRDGFGIAVGIYHLMILCESLLRWKLGPTFEELASSYGVVAAYLWGVGWYALMESLVALCFGMSLGLGMACVLCLSRPQPVDYFEDGNPLMRAELHVMVLGCLVGLGFVQNRYSRLLIPVVVSVMLVLLPPKSAFVFACGVTCGTCHGPLLTLGRSLFLTLNCVIKKVTTQPLGRHMVRHCLGLIPGLFMTRYVFGWDLVTSPLQSVIAHVTSAILLVAVNEIDISVRILPCPSLSVSSTSHASTSGYTSSSTSKPGIDDSPLTDSPLTSPAPTRHAPPTSPASSSHPTTTAAHKPTNLRDKFVDQLLSRRRTSSLSLAKEQPTAVLASSTSPVPSSPRLVIRDFAGHPLYYSGHHVYMAAQCVYVLVFNLVEAQQNFQHVLHNLIDWLQSIFLHAAFPDTRVFVVGTHRDDPRLKEAGGGGGGVGGGSDGDFVGFVGQRLRKEIPRSFHNMLVWTGEDVPLFPVENSLRDHKDKDHRYLREQLLKTVSEINTDKFPVRYFYFFHVLDDLRSEGRLLADTDDLHLQCSSNQCAIKDRDDMDAMLGLFRRLGEVLYFPEDNLLQSVVVLSPHGVLSVLSRLMDVPKRADRARRFLTEWDRLASSGVCSRALFEHVLDVHARELRRQSDTVVYLLQTLNLMCPLQGSWGVGGGGFEPRGGNGRSSVKGLRYRGRRGTVDSASGSSGGGGGGGGDSDDDDDKNNSDEENNSESDDDNSKVAPPSPLQDETSGSSGELYLVPAALPAQLPHDQCLWDPSATQDWQLLVDGIPLLPHAAFLRLLSACAAQDASHSLDDLGWPVLTASQTRAGFTLGKSRCYQLDWVGPSEVTDTYHGRLMRVSVAGWGQQGKGYSLHPGDGDGLGEKEEEGEVSPQSVVEFVWRTVTEIVRRDFGRCQLRLGVACPCSSPHQVCCDEVGFHFLSLSDTRDVKATLHVPEVKDFRCRGRHVIYSRGQVKEVAVPETAREQAPGVCGPALLDTPLSALPQNLHASICDLLDVPHVLGNDWTTLAGHLGKTVQEVALLKFRAPRDPCDALLQDWASRQPDVTLRHLLRVMQAMQRLDVIKTIQDYFP